MIYFGKYAFPHHRGQSVCSPTCAEQSEKKNIASVAITHILIDDNLGREKRKNWEKNGENFGSLWAKCTTLTKIQKENNNPS